MNQHFLGTAVNTATKLPGKKNIGQDYKSHSKKKKSHKKKRKGKDYLDDSEESDRPHYIMLWPKTATNQQYD